MNGNVGGGRWASGPAHYLLLRSIQTFWGSSGPDDDDNTKWGERVEKWWRCQAGLFDMLPGFELPGNKVIASNFYSWPWTCFEVIGSSRPKASESFSP